MPPEKGVREMLPLLFLLFSVTPVLLLYDCFSEFCSGYNKNGFRFPLVLHYDIIYTKINKSSCVRSVYRRPQIFYPITFYTAFSKAFFTLRILNTSWYTLTSNIKCTSSTPSPKKLRTSILPLSRTHKC